MKHYFLLLTTSLVLLTTAHAQFYSETIYTTKDGLKSNEVKDLIQTKDGYLWMINGGELCRFDGKDFGYFPLKNDVKVDWVNIDLTELESGEIMLRSSEFAKFNPKTQQFIYYADPPLEVQQVVDRATGEVKGLMAPIDANFDKNGNVFYVNYYGATLLFNDTCIDLKKTGNKALKKENRFNHGTQLDKNGTVWFSNNKKLFNYKNNKIVNYNIEQFGFDTATSVPYISFVFKNGGFLFVNVAWKNGKTAKDRYQLDTNIYYFDVKNNQLDTLNFLGGYIPDYNGNYIIENNNKWYCFTYRGLLIYDVIDKTHSIVENKEQYNRAILNKNNELILYSRVGENYGAESNSITIFDKNNYPTKIEFEKCSINKVVADDEENIWIASNKGLTKLSKAKVNFKASELFSMPIFRGASYVIDNKENIWFSKNTQFYDDFGELIPSKVKTILYKYDVKNKKLSEEFSELIQNIYQLKWDDVNNFLWVIFNDKFYQVKNGVLEKQNISFSSELYFQSINGNLFSSGYKLGTSILNNNKFEIISKKHDLFNLYITYRQKNNDVFTSHYDNGQIISVFNTKNNTVEEIVKLDSNEYSESILKDKNNNYWIFTYKDKIVYYNSPKLKLKKYQAYPNSGTRNYDIISVADNFGNVWATSNMGLVFLTINHDTIKSDLISKQHGLSSTIITDLYADNKNNLWIATDNGVDKLDIATYLKSGEVKLEHFGKKEGLRDVNCTKFEIRNNQLMVFTTSGYAIIDDNIKLTTKVAPKPFFSSVLTTINDSQFVFHEFEKSISFDNPFGPVFINFNAIKFNNTEELLYTTLLYKNDKLLYGNFDNINWSTVEQVKYEGLDPGTYKLEVYCKVGKKGEKSEPCTTEFTILPAWWQTYWFKGLLVIIGLLVIYLIFRIRTEALLKRQAQLEETVKIKTTEAVEQKQEAEKQRDIANIKNKEILDSLVYAKRLQEAILPSPKLVKEWLTESFILYKPKDIVAGDFYWMETSTQTIDGKEKTLIFFAAADCTGHGVPGAMVSVVCANALNRAVKEFGITDTGLALDKVSELVEEAFAKSEEQIKDGMDIALCAIDLSNKVVYYSGANNPLYRITKRIEDEEMALKSIYNQTHQLIEYKATKRPVGIHFDNTKFETHKIQLIPGDAIYLFSDGFADQFGGEKGKKLKYSTFKTLLLENFEASMEEQKLILDKAFHDWKGSLEQIDDVCVMGVKINGVERNNFTKSELEVLKYLEEGLSSKLIADKINLSKNTVDTYRRRLLAKTGTYNVTELINYCKKKEII